MWQVPNLGGPGGIGIPPLTALPEQPLYRHPLLIPAPRPCVVQRRLPARVLQRRIRPRRQQHPHLPRISPDRRLHQRRHPLVFREVDPDPASISAASIPGPTSASATRIECREATDQHGSRQGRAAADQRGSEGIRSGEEGLKPRRPESRPKSCVLLSASLCVDLRPTAPALIRVDPC